MKARLKADLRYGAGNALAIQSRDVEVVDQEYHSIFGRRYKVAGYPMWFEANAFEYIEGLIQLRNCNDCRYISITEREHVDKRMPHICEKHSCRVSHRASTIVEPHTWIYPCTECSGNDFRERIHGGIK